MKALTRLFLILFTWSLYAQVSLTTSATVSGTSAAVALSSTDAPYWVQFVAPSGNVSNARCGDSSTSSSRGLLIPPGAGQMLPPISGGIKYASLNTIYCYVATGDTLAINWAK